MVNETDMFPGNPSWDGYDDYIDFRLSEWQLQQQWLRNMRTRGVRDTHFVQDVGKYATPSSNTWEAYSNTVRACGMHFDPENYAFDRAVAKTSKHRALSDTSARHYAEYEPLRHNLAVVRNFILNHIYGEEIDAQEAQDKQKYAYVVQMGEEVGSILRRGHNPLLANPFSPSLSPKAANIEYDGAVAMYKKLLGVQTSNKYLAPLHFISELDKASPTDRAWRLPPIELTPFGKLNYYAPPPSDVPLVSDPLMADTTFMQVDALREDMAQTLAMDAVGSAFTHIGTGYNTVENLAQPIKLQAIEIAREILEKLKLQFSNTPVMAMLDYNSGQFQRTMTDLNSVILVYKDHLQRASMLDPSLELDPMVMAANDAAGFIGAQIKLRALDRAEMIGDSEHAEIIRKELEHLPREWLNPNRMTSAQALGALEQGLNMVVVTLSLIQEEGMEQNQRGLMLQASLSEPQEQMLKIQSLALDEQIQRLALERRNSFNSNPGAHKQAILRAPDSLLDQSKKGHQSSQSQSGSVFDSLLQNYNANTQQMQNVMNAPNSGNFSAGAPGNTQQIIKQVITHRDQTGLRGKKAQQKQQKQKQVQLHKQHALNLQKQGTQKAMERQEDTDKDETPDFTPTTPRGSRGLSGR